MMCSFYCIAQEVVMQAAPEHQNQKAVVIMTDEKEYKSKLGRDDYCIRGNIIKITITNGIKKEIYFDTNFIKPFTTLYFEIYKNKKWQTYEAMHGTAKYSVGFTFQKWIEVSIRLKPNVCRY